ncbi:MAG: MFS transporter [Candidatus Thorarchaeota archaeon]
MENPADDVTPIIDGRPIPLKPAFRFAGLSGDLWRLALVVGVAQFSMSVWTWQFGIYIETLIEPWQMGITFTASSVAGLLGVPISGYISDFIGRKKTLLLAYIPMALGLALLFTFPIWPYLPIFYGLVQFGWSFVVIMARAAPADQISQDGGKDAARTFTMALVPAFAMDGLSPLFASLLLMSGFPQRNLLIIGGFGTVIAFIVSVKYVRETLSKETREKARAGPIISLRGLGRDFWILALGMSQFAFCFGMAFSYIGNLVVNDLPFGWGVDAATWGIIWSASSLTIAAISYYGGELADKKMKLGLSVALAFNILFIFAMANGNGVWFLFFLNVGWSFFIVIWIGAERAFVVQGVREEMKGRALSTYQALMSTVQIFAMNLGAYIWTLSGSLRYLWNVSALIGGIGLIGILYALKSIQLKPIDEPDSFVQ